MSLSILQSIQSRKSRLSSIMKNTSLIEKLGDYDNLVLELLNLQSKIFISFDIVYDDEEGDDYWIEITSMGKSFLKSKLEQGE